MAGHIRLTYIPVKYINSRGVLDSPAHWRDAHVMNNISDIRKMRGLRQNDLADMVGISQPHISRIEGGDEGPPLSVFRSIADALNVPLSALFADRRSTLEQILLDAFRALPENRREGWVEMARLVQSEMKAIDRAGEQDRAQTGSKRSQ